MSRRNYRMTATAEAHFHRALKDTQQRWGRAQAEIYRLAFLEGLATLAKTHETLRTRHREALAAGTDFMIHLIEHRYVAFQVHNKNTIIIAGVFHESMDIPNRLREYQTMTQQEIADMKRTIDRIQIKTQ